MMVDRMKRGNFGVSEVAMVLVYLKMERPGQNGENGESREWMIASHQRDRAG